MPTCQQIMSVTVSGPLTIGPDLVARVHVLPPAGLGAPRGPSAAYWASIASISLVGVGPELDRVVLLACTRLRALGADHEPVLGREDRSVRRPGTPGPSIRARPARRTRSACRAPRPARCAGVTRDVGTERRPPLAGAGGVEGVDAPQRVALHQLAVLRRDLGHLVLADQRVAADQGRRCDARPPARRARVLSSAPQRVVVAVGHRDMAEGVDAGPAVVGRAPDGAPGRRSGPAAARCPRR